MLKRSLLSVCSALALYSAHAQQLPSKPVLKEDSITITGKYKNYHWKEGDAFSVAVNDWISAKQVQFSAPMNKDGTFRLRFPMQLAGKVYMDWGRLFEITSGIPGETFHIEADLDEYPDIMPIAQARDLVKLKEYFMRPRHINITGNNAQLHNEVMRLEMSMSAITDFMQAWKESKDPMVYRDSAMAAYTRKMAFLGSKKLLPATRLLMETDLRYNTLLDLSQFQYRVPPDVTLSNEYLNSIRQLATLNDTYAYLSASFAGYIRDMRAIAERGVVRAMLENGQEQVLSGDVAKSDSLMNVFINTAFMKQLLATWDAKNALEKNPVPMEPAKVAAFEQKVSDPFLRKHILRENAKLAVIAADSLSLDGTQLITTAPDMKSTEEVYNFIVQQHKGKVIYIDIWGTWCGPCREEMQHVPEMKKLLKDRNVVFVYLASGSPQPAWKNMIKYYKLTGHNVVHYNLPSQAQSLFEKEYLNRGWPTYILIDKEGKFVTKDAPRPSDPAAVVEAVNKLL